MSCLPGMPCNPIGPLYPEGMGPCNPPPPYSCINASQVIYEGPNLPCSGISTNDSVDVALQKLDDAVCPENILSQIIQVLQVNPELRYKFCQIVNGCIPTTTTTTTTGVPFYTYTLAEGNDAPTACSSYPSSAQPFYSSDFTLNVGTALYTDPSLTIPVGNDYYSDGTTSWEVTGGSGVVSNGIVC